MSEQPEIKLSVEVPENNEENHPELEMDQENEEPKISLDLQQPDDEETERTKYGLNSPKKKKKQSRDLDDEAEADEGEMTPATKLRQTAGINSPKQQKAMAWGNNEENNGNTNALAGVITQVQQDENQTSTGKGGVESLVYQVSREDAQAMAPMSTTQDEDKDTTKPKDQQKDQNAGICACLTSLFTCCSTSSSIENQTAQEIARQEKNDAPPATKDSKAVTTTNDQTKENEKEQEVENSQESSTDYSYALLPPLSPENKGKRCLVLDLDETLVHSSFKPVNSADFTIPVEIDGVVHRVYVLKRPFVDEFLLECSKSYELVIFTASLSKYADPLLDQLDTHRVIAHRLFRESCTFHGSAYVKDMRRLGRRLKDVIFVDNSPNSYAFQPKNAVPITSWFDDRTDTQLRDFIPVLNTTLLKVKDVRSVLDAHNKPFSWLCRQANVDISKFEPC